MIDTNQPQSERRLAAIMFTDVFGFAAHTQRNEDLAMELLEEQREVVRPLLVKFKGWEVKTTGDGFLVEFASALEAVSCAVEIQTALKETNAKRTEGERMLVRIGIHVGDVIHREGDVVGDAVNIASRIERLAPPGGICVTAQVHASVVNKLGHEFESLGSPKLKNISTPVEVFLVSGFGEAVRDAEGAEVVYPAIESRPSPGSVYKLPFVPTSFVGREKELDEIAKLIQDPACRLLTLLGPGGAGKTRLAIETARSVGEAYAQGVYFVPLAPVSSPEHIIPTVADALDFIFHSQSSDLEPKDQLLQYLSTRSALIVMDNFEHLVDAADFVVDLLEHTRDVKLLVTSRERLNVKSEWTFEVEGLPYPKNGTSGNAQQYSAIELFVDRARQAEGGFAQSEGDQKCAARICKMVLGMPLAIELAASWTAMLDCNEIASELQQNLDFLATSMRDVPERHRSMRAVFDHSWNLLSEPERKGIARLSVICGAFDRRVAQDVADVDLRLLTDLINTSLLRRDAQGDYEIHELLHQYAAEKLHAMAEEEERVQNAHARYFVAQLSGSEKELMGAKMLETRSKIRKEIVNVRAAVLWASIHWPEEEARAALDSLYVYYLVEGWHEGREEFGRLAKLIKEHRGGNEEDIVYLNARIHQANLTSVLGQHDEGEEIARAGLSPLRAIGSGRELSDCLLNLGINALYRGEYQQSQELLQESIALGRENKIETQVGIALLWLGWAYYQMGDYAQANVHFNEGYELFQKQQNDWGMAFALTEMGLAADGLKKYEQAMNHHQASLEIFEKMGDLAGEAYATSRMSVSAYGMTAYEEALRFSRAGNELFQEIGHLWGTASSLCRMGFAYVGLENLKEARGCFYEALDLAMENQMPSLALSALAGLSAAMARGGEAEQALELFTFVEHHPATPSLYKEIARSWLAGINVDLPPDKLAKAKERGEAEMLEEVVEEVKEFRG